MSRSINPDLTDLELAVLVKYLHEETRRANSWVNELDQDDRAAMRRVLRKINRANYIAVERAARRKSD